jgi:ClpX C4-type zinc finger
MAADERCPVCGGDLAGGELILVCGSCHHSLGNVVVRATGEFVAPTAAALAAAAPDLAPPVAPARACSWCNRREHEVKKLLTSGHVAICNECVALCADVLGAELGDWR